MCVDRGVKHQIRTAAATAIIPSVRSMCVGEIARTLDERFGIVFTGLYTLANMPIQRFGSWLLSQGRFDEYLQTLRDAHREENLDTVMCRDLLSVDWQGFLHDCDFNQMLGLPARVAAPSLAQRHEYLLALSRHRRRPHHAAAEVYQD